MKAVKTISYVIAIISMVVFAIAGNIGFLTTRSSLPSLASLTAFAVFFIILAIPWPPEESHASSFSQDDDEHEESGWEKAIVAVIIIAFVCAPFGTCYNAATYLTSHRSDLLPEFMRSVPTFIIGILIGILMIIYFLCFVVITKELALKPTEENATT